MNLTGFWHTTGQWLRGETRLTPTAGVANAGPPRVRKTGNRAADKRYCLTIAADGDEAVNDRQLAQAWQTLEADMALVPAGETDLVAPVIAPRDEEGPLESPIRRVRVRAAYIDRCAVTNADFARFVAAGGYRETERWPAQLLPQVLQFTDQTGRPGPRYWRNGEPPADKLEHPVVGVSWYEAHAYAAWIGKRLPTSAEWQRAACWSDCDGVERRYPWGNAFVPGRANTWLGGVGDTQPVESHYDGCTPNGIYQLVGNVWEWTATAFECQTESPDCQLLFDQPMAEVRGGAFDTYFETQATCQFRSGQPLLRRGPNLGFRCCIGAEGLRKPEQPQAFLDRER